MFAPQVHVDRHRRSPERQLERIDIVYGDLSRPDTLGGACTGVETLFHLGGYAHADDDAATAASLHWQVTVEGTRALLAEAARASVRRLVYLGSVKAMGEGGPACLDERGEMRPVTAYGRAKLEAERLVAEAGRQGMSVCVLRLPLVYGRGSKGNLPRMIAAIDQGRFPPLPEVHNRRSMVHVDDVVRALLLAARRPEASGQTYIVTDDQTYSTRQIYELICRALGKRTPRWTFPLGTLQWAAKGGDLIGRVRKRPFFFDSATLEKLTGSAWYSSRKIARELSYRPACTLQSALPGMVDEYRAPTGLEVETEVMTGGRRDG